jgi:two-component system, chemotaxis family, response regulator Rcp1
MPSTTLPQHKFHILLIEDQEGEAHLFSEALREAAPRVNVYWVATGREGMEFLRQENRFKEVGPVDIVVSDLNMPGMSGYDLLKELKGDPTFKRTPVIIYSASRYVRDIELCYLLGANAYLVKSMTPEGMIKQIGTMVQFWLEAAKLPNAAALID